ncbi:MAG: hypothetical protein IT585_14145 [candidate division Zixibacteria bacterium]|nr:hypothetical protein [candidate division Zixibacteria bacterium]
MKLANADGWLDRANVECHESFPDDSIDLAPGDTIMFAFSLLGIYGRGGRQTKYPPCIPLGDYKIEAEYMGDFVAQPCHFSVVPLTADEERQISLFTSVWNSQLKGKHRYAAYVDVYSKLKGTPFGSFACEMIISQPASYEPSPERRRQDAREYLTNYPSERRTDLALSVLIKYSEANKLQDYLSAIPSLRQNRFLRHALKNVSRRLNDMTLYREVMK